MSPTTSHHRIRVGGRHSPARLRHTSKRYRCEQKQADHRYPRNTIVVAGDPLAAHSLLVENILPDWLWNPLQDTRFEFLAGVLPAVLTHPPLGASSAFFSSFRRVSATLTMLNRSKSSANARSSIERISLLGLRRPNSMV